MPNFEASEANKRTARRISDLLSACPIGGSVTYSELRRAAGRHIREIDHIFRKALKTSNEEAGASFKNVRGVGYERLPGLSTVLGRNSRDRARRSHRNASKMMGNSISKTNAPSSNELRAAFRELTHLGLLEQLSRDRAVPKLPDGALPTDPGHAVRRTLDAMREALGRVV